MKNISENETLLRRVLSVLLTLTELYEGKMGILHPKVKECVGEFCVELDGSYTHIKNFGIKTEEERQALDKTIYRILIYIDEIE